MRAYLPVTPSELRAFVETGLFHAAHAFIVDPKLTADASVDDQEELEFEVSWQAAEKSRAVQSEQGSMGFVLAVELEEDQVGQIQGDEVSVTADISWSQVQSLLLSESDEPELSWFAPQEVPSYLPQWSA